VKKAARFANGSQYRPCWVATIEAMDEKQRAFQEFERAGWDRAVATYGDAAGELTSQVAPILLAAASVSIGDRVLDVASGPGYVAAEAAAVRAVPVGVDISAAMVAEAARL
jgi:SAM-dependent methyltransferase